LVKHYKVPSATFNVLGVPCGNMFLLLTLAVIAGLLRDIGHGDKRPCLQKSLGGLFEVRRVFRIRGEGKTQFKIFCRRGPGKSIAKPSDQDLLFRLLELRVRKEADGEAYFDLLREYLERALRAGLDMDRLREYLMRIEVLGDDETLREVEKFRLVAGRDA